jgi:hypothetical protein
LGTSRPAGTPGRNKFPLIPVRILPAGDWAGSQCPIVLKNSAVEWKTKY